MYVKHCGGKPSQLSMYGATYPVQHMDTMLVTLPDRARVGTDLRTYASKILN